nr:LysR family transcriptional regulator [uncultured Devosia sp.]
MNLRQMEVFHAIMRAGSVTGAAKLLNVTQPAVSTTLRHCEDQLRIKLFDRTGGRMRPTPEAEAIFPDIANIFQRVDTVSRVASDLAGGRLGAITVGATFAIANGPLAKAIAEFSVQNPDVRFAVHALPTVQVVERVARREADFGFGFSPIDDPAVETEVLRSAEIACVMPASHPLAELEAITVDDLAGHPIITYAPATAIGGPVEAAFRDSQVDLVRTIQVNYSMTAFTLAGHGAGIALVEPMLFNPAAMPHLVCRPFKPAVSVQTILIKPLGRPLLRTSRSFIQLVRQYISQGTDMHEQADIS